MFLHKIRDFIARPALFWEREQMRVDRDVNDQLDFRPQVRVGTDLDEELKGLLAEGELREW